MNILLDAHMLGENEGGNERYVKNLLNELMKQKRISLKALVTKNFFLSNKEKKLTRYLQTQPIKNNLFRLAFWLPLLAQKNESHIVHSTYIAPFFKNSKSVVMVHDLSFKRFPEFYSPRERFIFNCLLPYSIAKADAVIVPSNFTKNELIKYYPTYKNIEKVFVIENGIDKAFNKINKKRASGEIFKKYKIKLPYILTINSRNPKKNIDGVIKGFNLFLIENPKYKLIIVNGRHNIKEKNLKRIMILNHVSDEDLKNLYNGCELFIYYSKYEGFGMPIVEALQCGAPVIASDIPPHREITDDKIIYVKPSDFIDLSSKMDFLIKNRQFQEQMVEKTKKTISRFTWENNAKKTIDLYKLILNH